ncbi:TPA: 50S ribosomal protein L32e [archaeon]|uniref:Large ribosomal subunit protein eL32 n=1 Tax=Candidatus Naiadarchaeum limnaeum TaxID=2756139 RepID=A0A832V1P3_9ARCH|nr:50S ribosomal protein L32e [Candidatus Naiadarchaeum limnaeum]
MAEEKTTVIETRKKLISRLKKRKPWFRRYSHFAYSFPDNWRKPTGLHSKMREDEKNKPATVKPGYRTAKIIRYLHPSGYEEVYVRTLNELQKIDSKTQAARLASGLSEKKRKTIAEKAKQIGVKVLNP